jgi:hypothetical protein
LLAGSARHREPGPTGHAAPRAAWLAAGAALVVAAVALGPEAAVLEPNVPLTVQPVSLPHWFADTAVHLPPRQVLLTYPFATADSQSAIPWQAIDGMRYQMAGGGGPAGTVAHAGSHQLGFAVLRAASVPLLAAPTMTTAHLTARLAGDPGGGTRQRDPPGLRPGPRHHLRRGLLHGRARIGTLTPGRRLGVVGRRRHPPTDPTGPVSLLRVRRIRRSPGSNPSSGGSLRGGGADRGHGWVRLGGGSHRLKFARCNRGSGSPIVLASGQHCCTGHPSNTSKWTPTTRSPRFARRLARSPVPG